MVPHVRHTGGCPCLLRPNSKKKGVKNMYLNMLQFLSTIKIGSFLGGFL